MATRTVGVIVNPIAGMGGRVGLKGTDSPEILRQARDLGSIPQAPRRTVAVLRELADHLKAPVTLLAGPAEMGADEVREAGLQPVIVGSIRSGATAAADTEAIARGMVRAGVDLLIFAGGDGTARNICHAVGDRVPVIGIPSGVKMHSAVFAAHPRAAAELAARYLDGQIPRLQEAEVMDIDEEAFRNGRVSARLYGYLRVPYQRNLVQAVKSGSTAGEEGALDGMAGDVIERMKAAPDQRFIFGPGTTTRAIAQRLGAPKTLLGVDVFFRGQLAAADVSEQDLLRMVEDRPARIVVTPIGGQGYVFGRGNQQISPAVIRRVGRENIIIVATPGKVTALRGDPFRVDTGDAEVDEMLRGYIRVVVGYHGEMVYRIA